MLANIPILYVVQVYNTDRVAATNTTGDVIPHTSLKMNNNTTKKVNNNNIKEVDDNTTPNVRVSCLAVQERSEE